MEPLRDVKGRWKKGIPSPNSLGRPKRELSITQKMRDVIDLDKYVKSVLEAAYNGDISAAKLVWDRLEGRLASNIEPDGEFVIQVMYVSRQPENSDIIDIEEGEQ